MKWQGKGVSEGLAMAQIHLFTPKLPEISRQPAADAEAEVAKLEATLAAAEEEYAAVLSYLYLLELDHGYTQDFSAASADYIPEFNLEGL